MPVGALTAGVGSLMAIGKGAATVGALAVAFFAGAGAGGGGGVTLGEGGSMNCDITTTGTTSSTARMSKPL